MAIPGMSNVQHMFHRAALALKAGISFGGARDLYQVFGYERNPDHKNFVAKYLAQDVARRVIDKPVEDTWTDAPIIEGANGFKEAWDTLVKEHDIYHHLAKVDKFAGLGAFALLVIGIDDGRRLSDPVIHVAGGTRHKIIYLQPYLEGSCAVETYDTNENSPRFGKPLTYRVSPGDVRSVLQAGSGNTLRERTAFIVHYTRVLHLADNTLENPIFGYSRLRAVNNILDDILKVAGGSAETFWLAANRGLQVDVDKEMELDPDDAELLSQEIEEYQHQLRRVIRTRGVKVHNLGSDIADPRGAFAVLVSLLSAATGIPQRVLMGAEAGQLASQQDRANWAIVLASRIALWAEPTVLKPFIKTLVGMNVLPDPGISLKVTWPETFKMNPLERGQTSAQQARSITNVARAMETFQKVGVDGVSVEEARQMTAPGDKVLIMDTKAVGTFPPKLSAPYNEPQNKAISPVAPVAPDGNDTNPASSPGSTATLGTPGSTSDDD